MYALNDLRYGGYFLHEKVAPEGFLLDEGYYYFEISEHGKTVIVETEAGKNFINQPIKGNVQTTKVDAEYPDNKLTGAIFEIYIDIDGNGKFDAAIDMLYGQMTESKDGVYTMTDLRYGGYFLHEKTAPEGFLLDDGYYYFAISENGETVIVENEAGKSFINQPMVGELLISKTDSATDKPLANVGFRVFDEDGKIVFEGYTDENGIISLKLRLGKYTYQEFAPLDGYVPDETVHEVEITEHGQIIKENVANKKASTSPDTGDHVNLHLWVAVALISLCAIIVLIDLRRREKKNLC